MRHHDYIPELDGPQSYIAPGGKRILCKGGGGGALLGALAGAVLAPFTGGMSMLAGAAAGASLGSALIDTPKAAKEQQKAQEKAAVEQTKAATQAADNTKRQADAAEQAFNRANSRRPDTAAMLSGNEMAAKGGLAGTMLTGPAGVDPAALQLGRNTLLGA